MEREVMIEASMPVQSRVNVVYLAKLASYWESEGYGIRTMSQLVSWSIDLLHEILVANGKVSEEDVKVIEARNYLVGRGLMQRSMMNRSFMKMGTAVRFEQMRERGIDPRSVDPIGYNVLHKKVGINKVSKTGRSVEPFVGEVTSTVSDEDWETIQMRIKEAEAEEREALMKKEMESARNSGLVVSDDWISERQRKDKEIRERENAPVDPSMFKVVKEP
jgi:hypothetical protein